MKWTNAFIALAVLAGTASADPIDLRRVGLVKGDAKTGASKVAVCVACHGPEGNAVVPAFPTLAGQQAGYLHQSLLGFQRRNDPASPMTAQVKDLSDRDLRDIAAYFASRQRNVTLNSSDDNSLGATLFRNGDPTRGIPPCQGCHGFTALGHPMAAENPRFDYYPNLAGQHAEYLIARLGQYHDGKQTSTSNALIMQGVAHNLDADAIHTLANWLSATPH